MSVTVVVYGLVFVLLSRFTSSATADTLSTQWGQLNVALQRWLCGLKVEIHGAEHIPKEGACLILSKHQSAWETIAFRGLFRPDQSWVLKQELLKIPFFGWSLKAVSSIAIDRSAGRRAVLQLVKEGRRYLLEEKRLVIIFPEGTRTAPGERRKYGLGGALLAEKAQVDVVPIAHNAGVFWKRRGVKKYPGTIQVHIGPPISTIGKKASEINELVEAWIEEKQLELPIER